MPIFQICIDAQDQKPVTIACFGDRYIEFVEAGKPLRPCKSLLLIGNRVGAEVRLASPSGDTKLVAQVSPLEDALAKLRQVLSSFINAEPGALVKKSKVALVGNVAPIIERIAKECLASKLSRTWIFAELDAFSSKSNNIKEIVAEAISEALIKAIHRIFNAQERENQRRYNLLLGYLRDSLQSLAKRVTYDATKKCFDSRIVINRLAEGKLVTGPFIKCVIEEASRATPSISDLGNILSKTYAIHLIKQTLKESA
ncbi:MAG: hypothetical protein DSY42_02510 [Aquifex sp.]|nr:MAG: hypothetical protein DSY42_02510 [Aquifex sp.]